MSLYIIWYVLVIHIFLHLMAITLRYCISIQCFYFILKLFHLKHSLSISCYKAVNLRLELIFKTEHVLLVDYLLD